MRVTKVIKEYIEKKIHEKCDAAIDAIKVDRFRDTEEGKAKLAAYMDFAEEKFVELVNDLAAKRNELGIPELKTKSSGTYEEWLHNSLFENKLDRYPPTTKINLSDWIKDEAYDEFVENSNKMRKEYHDKVDDIIIRLELGEIAKQELEDVLAEI